MICYFLRHESRRGKDLVAAGWHDDNGTSVYVVQEKGRRKVELWIEAHPVLKAALDEHKVALAGQSPVPLTILMAPNGTSCKVNQFQKAAAWQFARMGPCGTACAPRH